MCITHTDTHTMEYYSPLKNSEIFLKSEIMPSAATWMGLEIIILSEVNQRNTI